MSTSITSHTATRSEDFVQSIGINTHLSDVTTTYGNLQAVASQLAYLGVDKARDVIPGASLAAYQALAAEGIRFSLEYPSLALLSSDLAVAIQVLNTLGEAVLQVEGPNEPNVIPVSFNGVGGTAGAVALQEALYAAVHDDPTLNNAIQTTPVLMFSLAPRTVFPAYGDLSAYADYTNVHIYALYGVPPYWAMQTEVNSITTSPGKPLQITEAGEYTLNDGQTGVSQSVEAKWDVDTLLEAYTLGSSGTFLYELDDLADPSGNNAQFHYGLYNADGTPKLAAVAIHDLTTILGDTSAGASGFTAGSLSYALTGMPYYGFQNLTEKADGTFDLALWAEPPIWDSKNDTDVYVKPSAVTVSFAQSFATINVYDVLLGTAPVATYHNVDQLPISLGSDPLIVEIIPTAAPAPDQVTLAAGVTTLTGHVVATAGAGSTTVFVDDAETVVGGAGALMVNLAGNGDSVTGGAGALSVLDGSGGNTIGGGGGAFSIDAAVGDDQITTGTSASNVVTLGSGKNAVVALGATRLVAGAGDANVTLSGGGNVVTGGSGILMLADQAGGNTIAGGGGTFAITALSGGDVITTGRSAVNSVVLGAGDDTVTAIGQSTIAGGAGDARLMLESTHDVVVGGAGTLRVIDLDGGNTFAGGAGVLDLVDLVGNDLIDTGAAGRSYVTLGSGGNTVSALGATTLFGGAGAATVSLASSGSSIVAGTGGWTVTDTVGGNTIVGGTGAFAATVGAGADVISTANSAGVDSVVLGAGTDTVNARGTTDIVANQAKLTVTGNGNVSVNGGMGSLTLALAGATGGEYVFTQAGTANLLTLGDGANRVASHGADTIRAGAGKDSVLASGSSVLVYGGSGMLGLTAGGATTYVGGAGTTTVTGGAGSLSINGGLGSITLTGGTGSDDVFTQAGTHNLLKLGSAANMVVSQGADTIDASTASGAAPTGVNAAGPALIYGGAGALSVNGGAAAVTVIGGAGAVNASAAGDNSSLRGGSLGGNVLSTSASDVTLVGAGGGDTLTDAGSGNNTLVAGAGRETLAGGTGVDQFVFNKAAAPYVDMVGKFQPGVDQVSFVGFGATPIASQSVVGGNLQLVLSDHSQITFLGVTSLGA